jgi:hypothetical protein
VFKSKSEPCPASGWPVSSSATRPTGGSKQKCPSGGHKVKTTPVTGRPGAVKINEHRRKR